MDEDATGRRVAREIIKIFKDRDLHITEEVTAAELAASIQGESERQAGIDYGLQHGWFEIDDAKNAYRLTQIGFTQEKEIDKA
jgi:hypothetical protein